MPCSVCKGDCCYRGYDAKYMPHDPTPEDFEETDWWDERVYHDCQSCKNGRKPTSPPLPRPRTAEDERADLVAYLAHAARFPNPTLPMNQYMDTLRELIACGAHVGFSKKEKP